MALEDKGAQHDKEVVDKFADPEATYQMTTRDYVVRPSADGDTGAIILTLPPVADAKGRFYSIIARNADAVNTITVADMDDSECWLGDLVLNGKCDRILLYSDGIAWWPAFQSGWPQIPGTKPPGTVSPSTAAPTTLTPTTEAPE